MARWWGCGSEPSPPWSMVDGVEDCDDGNAVWDDGYASNCQRETD